MFRLRNDPRSRSRTRRSAPPAPALVGALLVVLVAAAGTPDTQQDELTPDSGGRPAPATAPAGATSFQPGVWINWQQQSVVVAGHIVLRQGPLEFLACFEGKEHESIIRLDASAMHVYLALGLVGLTPGQPARWDETTRTYTAPSGDPVDVRIEWKADGPSQSAAAAAWLLDVEYARVPAGRPWLFSGSIRLRDGGLAADRSGAGIALVDMPDGLLALARHYSSRNEDLWVEANEPALPPLRTPVHVVLRAARPRPRRIALDFRGDFRLDERFASARDVADAVGLARQFDAACVQTIDVRGALESDVARARRLLSAAGVPPEALRFTR